MNSQPNQSYLVELIATLQCSRFGYGEGEHPLGFANVTPAASGDGSFHAANATNSAANPSESSACYDVR